METSRSIRVKEENLSAKQMEQSLSGNHHQKVDPSTKVAAQAVLQQKKDSKNNNI
jgi:hypothetical protein